MGEGLVRPGWTKGKRVSLLTLAFVCVCIVKAGGEEGG